MSEEDKNHFDDNPKAKIHTSRWNKGASPKGCPPGDKGTCNYGKKRERLKPKDKRGFSNVHHLLSVGPVNAYEDHAKATAIEAMYHGTEWCISHTENLIRLPHKKYYLECFVKGGSRKADPKTAPSDPCHDVHHNHYLDEVVEELRDKVWNQVGEVQEDGKCFGEEQTKAQLNELHSGTDGFRERLATRGKRGSGIPALLALMAPSTVYDEGELGKQKHWWLPFSMAKDSVAKRYPIQELYARGEPPAAIKKKRG